MALQVDQSQLTGASGVGFGQFASVRSRVQGFVPTVNRIDFVGFYFNGSKGTKGLRVELQTISSGNPSGTVLASAVVANASLNASGETVIPLTYFGLTPGTAYALVLMPWDTATDLYADDYRDMVHIISNAYPSSSYWKFDTGSYFTENIDFKFKTYYEDSPPSINKGNFFTMF